MKKKKIPAPTQAPRCPNHLNRKVVKLGVCLGCYNVVYSRIRRGLTTWEEARAEGVIGPPGKRGRPTKIVLGTPIKTGRPLKKLKAAF